MQAGMDLTPIERLRIAAGVVGYIVRWPIGRAQVLAWRFFDWRGYR